MMLARAVQIRGFATRLRSKDIASIPPQVLDRLPILTDPTPPKQSKAVSAHCIDVVKQDISFEDSVAISPTGSVVHGSLGDLGSDAASRIPLEYLALLRPAAEGCAALRSLGDKKGTILVLGAGEAAGMAASQIAAANENAVVAVVGAEHSGNDDFMESLKGLISEPGTAVPETYAMSKKLFADLVASISSGDDGTSKPATSEEYLSAFKQNFIDQSIMYPDTRPAAVAAKHLEFEYMEKDRKFWEENMEAYLEQYPPGSPPVDKNQLEATFSAEQYEIFRKKFWTQTSAVISGDDLPFSAPHIVQEQILAPESLDKLEGHETPYWLSILNQHFPAGTEADTGGPVVGAVICVSEDLKIAAEKVAAAKSLRKKGEALQFLTQGQRAAFSAANSVVAQATKAGGKVVLVGEKIPGFDEPVKATKEDVATALDAMDIAEDGSTKLNYFVQVYNATEFPFYADYAVHRASEPLAGPRQIVVTK